MDRTAPAGRGQPGRAGTPRSSRCRLAAAVQQRTAGVQQAADRRPACRCFAATGAAGAGRMVGPGHRTHCPAHARRMGPLTRAAGPAAVTGRAAPGPAAALPVLPRLAPGRRTG
ncbi:hypothetical protein G6F32_015624 [Rhizopus arrhizus]|nr:hypothetical protein G6F32_015624 [Rhizopus arrhizus]